MSEASRTSGIVLRKLLRGPSELPLSLRLIISRDTLYSYTCGKGCFFGSVSAIRIDEEVSHVYLVLPKVETGDGFIFMHDDCHVTIIAYGTDIVPELASMRTVARGCELEFADDPHAQGDCVSGDPEGYLQVSFIDDCSRDEREVYDREVRNELRFRDAFVAYACKSVISGHEEVVPADVAAGVERWPFGSD